MLDLVTGVVAALGGGAALGALSALMGWASSGEPFEGKKMGIGIATGVIAGIAIIALSFPAIKSSIAADNTGLALLELMIPIGLSIVGTDLARAKISGMITARATESTTVTVTEEKPSPA